jgi:hypothetical protein
MQPAAEAVQDNVARNKQHSLDYAVLLVCGCSLVLLSVRCGVAAARFCSRVLVGYWSMFRCLQVQCAAEVSGHCFASSQDPGIIWMCKFEPYAFACLAQRAVAVSHAVGLATVDSSACAQ